MFHSVLLPDTVTDGVFFDMEANFGFGRLWSPFRQGAELLEDFPAASRHEPAAYGNHVRELKCGEPATTNNRMELQAAIFAFESLKEPCEVTLFTDSEYSRGGTVR